MKPTKPRTPKVVTIDEFFQLTLHSIEKMSEKEKAELRQQICDKYLPPSMRWVN